MTTTIVTGLVVVAILGIIGVVIVQNILTSQTTTSWDATVSTLFPFIGVAVVAVVIIGLFKFLRG